MDVHVTPASMRAWARHERQAGHRIAVVPTMGALHDGHLSLVRDARNHADRVVVTIFVNPLQFNQAADFDAYPTPIDADLAACRTAGVDAVYAPTAATMYPPAFQTHVQPGILAERLEGPVRPGHFSGVTTVVAKLFGATDPDVAVFGRKDFQQLAVVRRMVTDLDMGIEVIGVPIVREPDGLARSSRNVRLTPDDRAASVVLSRALAAGADAIAGGERSAAVVREVVAAAIMAEPRASLEYVDVVDPDTLERVEHAAGRLAIVLAAWFGEVRLIDNMMVGELVVGDDD
ncbi:MAG: pantoate--beta-alanine ligase [Ilumatobacteraceae bacterium]